MADVGVKLEFETSPLLQKIKEIQKKASDLEKEIFELSSLCRGLKIRVVDENKSEVKNMRNKHVEVYVNEYETKRNLCKCGRNEHLIDAKYCVDCGKKLENEKAADDGSLE